MTPKSVDTVADILEQMRAQAAAYEAEKATWVGVCGSCGERAKGDKCSACEKEHREREAAGKRALWETIRTIPERYRWCTFGAEELIQRVKMPLAIERVRNTASKADRITLLGPAGAGKTVLATCALQQRARAEGKSGIFVEAYTLATARAQHGLGDGEADDVRDAKRAHILLVDDVGSEPTNPQSALVEVLHERHAQMLPTFVTTWMTPAELKHRYGDGCARRMIEGATVVDMTPRTGAK